MFASTSSSRQKRHTSSLTLKLSNGAMTTMTGASSEHQGDPFVTEEEFEQDQAALVRDLVAN